LLWPRILDDFRQGTLQPRYGQERGTAWDLANPPLPRYGRRLAEALAEENLNRFAETDISIAQNDELLRRLRESPLSRLWLPRRENFFAIDALPVLGSGKLDLKGIKETAKRLSAAILSAAPQTRGQVESQN
jgi:hypothetical protein